MAQLRLKGDIITYTFNSGTTTPSANYSGNIGFSESIGSIVTGGTYNLYISTHNNTTLTGESVYEIIDLLDGVESESQIPTKGSKSAPNIPSSRCAVSTEDFTITFDVLYNNQTHNTTYKYIQYFIKVISIEGSIRHQEAVGFSYNFYGTHGTDAVNSGGKYQVTTGSISSR